MNHRAVYTLLAVLFFLHQDFWFWDNGALTFGFLPIGLAYHILFSVAAAVGWWLALRFAWPDGLDEVEEKGDGEDDLK